jgi:tetraacyldisaccharide 4'-kinase
MLLKVSYPLHLVYKGITSFRNFLFDQGLLKEFHPEVPTIGVGNLTVGGTGKTPMVDFLLDLLSDRNLGVISRGYGRRTKGFLEIQPSSTAEEVGDEPRMLADKHPEVRFFVSEDRVNGIRRAQELYSDINAFIFDDVYQHRYVKPDFLILLSDFNRPFYKDHVLPYGRLRESRKGADRADVVIITKCPLDLSDFEKAEIEKEVRKYSTAPVFFAPYLIQVPQNGKGQLLERGTKVVLLSAIAENKKFFEQQSKNYEIIRHYAFRDHYKIPQAKIKEILSTHKDLAILTTEKDWVKIKQDIGAEDMDRVFTPVVKVGMGEDFGKYLRTQLGFVEKP